VDPDEAQFLQEFRQEGEAQFLQQFLQEGVS
jgi:hypothetical protein